MEREHSKNRPLVPYSNSDSDIKTPEKRIKEDCSCCGIRFNHYSAFIKHRKKHYQEGQGIVEEKTSKYYTLPSGLVDKRLKQLYHDKFHHIMVPHRFSQVIISLQRTVRPVTTKCVTCSIRFWVGKTIVLN